MLSILAGWSLTATLLHAAEPSRELRLHVVYVTNQDRPPLPGYRQRIHRIMTDVQAFYRDEMQRNGYGPKTFPLDLDGDGQVRVHLVALPWDFDSGSPFLTHRMAPEITRVLAADGLDSERTYYIALQNGYWQDGATWRYDIPYTGSGNSASGKTWVADHEWLDPLNFASTDPEQLDDRGQKLTRPQFNTKMIGGVAHELGHGFGLPHNREQPEELVRLGNALMGAGNYTYGRERYSNRKGAFITPAHAFALSLHPLFVRERAADLSRPATSLDGLDFQYAGGKLLVSGSLSPPGPVAGLVLYHDKLPTGVNKDYDAWSYYAPIDRDGRFVKAVDLPDAGEYALHLCVYYRNGMHRKWSFNHRVQGELTPDLGALRRAASWNQLTDAWEAKDTVRVLELAPQVQSIWPERKEQVNRFVSLAKLWDGFPWPGEIPPGTNEISLSQTRWQTASVGWYVPSFDGILTPDGASCEPLASSVNAHPHGLFAHADARYVYRLGGKWQTFSARVGLQKSHAGSVVFVVVGDGRELARSPLLTLADGECEIRADVAGVEQLELRTEAGPDGRNSDWGIWFSPLLAR
jgi:hypothetical protein